MRHRKKRSVLLESGAKKKSIVLRNLLTSLVLHGSVTTTPAKARSLKAYADKFFSRLMKHHTQYATDQDALRENIRLVKSTIYGEDAGKKVIRDMLPRYKETKQQSFVADYKVGFRPGDAAMKVLVTLL